MYRLYMSYFIYDKTECDFGYLSFLLILGSLQAVVRFLSVSEKVLLIDHRYTPDTCSYLLGLPKSL